MPTSEEKELDLTNLKIKKRGPFSAHEKEFIIRNAGKSSISDIALHLNRTEDAIRDVIKKESAPEIVKEHSSYKEPKAPKAKKKEILSEIELSILEQEFSSEEMEYFKEVYVKYEKQFGEDILATEQTQIITLIKYEILMHRNLAGSKKCQRDVNRMEKEQIKFYEAHDDEEDMSKDDQAYISNLESQLLSHRTALASKSTEYTKLTEKHSSIMKEMKATRDQRLSKIDNAAKDFLSLMKVTQIEEFREKEGYQSAILNHAAKLENERLSQPHKYVDGGVDIPMLTPENVLKIKLEDKDE